MQNPSNICPRCQSTIPADAPGGLCPACVLLGVVGKTNPSQAAAATAPTMEEVAAAFPDLELVEILGQGGMGIVFKARQPRLDRFVALKVLPPALAAQAGFAERFTREARVLARLAHPNIVAIYDFGESAGFFYLIMEFVNGVNLRAAMRAGVTPGQALLLVPRICEALQFAHDHGVLHRDIKPENILLDTAGVPKLADFGIAKLADEPGGRTSLTATGHALGTAAYMAPEQVEKPSTVDHRADIYSLGVVLYEMLTGELPLGRFAAPSEKSPVDQGVDEVVLRALEKERERRQQSATDFKTQVEGASHPGFRPNRAAAPAMHRKDALVTRILIALAALSAVGIPLIAMLGWPPTSKYMVVLTIFFGTCAGLSKLFAPPVTVPAPAYTAPPKEKDLGIAYLCWFILGPSGLHKFYLGEIGWGFLYLFTGGLFLIGWFIDLFTLPGQVRRHNEKMRLAPTSATPTSTGALPQGAYVFIAIILFSCLVVSIVKFVGRGPSGPAPTTAAAAGFPPAAVVTTARPPFIGELTQGSLELVAIAPHPSSDARGWRMDGAPAAEGPFVNRGSNSFPQAGQRAFEFVFRTRNLPAAASTPTWRISGASGWAGGGEPLLDGKPSLDCQIISAAFSSDRRKTDIHMGVAAGPWHTLSENRPLSQNSSSFSYKGEDWVLTQGSGFETKDGETVVTFSYSLHEHWQTRVVAVDAANQEIAPSRSSGFSGQSESRFAHLPLENVRQFRFQVRPYEWVKFDDVALDPSRRSATPPAAETPQLASNRGSARLDVRYTPNGPGLYRLSVASHTPYGSVADFSCRIRDEKGEREVPSASFIVARRQPAQPGGADELRSELTWDFNTRDMQPGFFQLKGEASRGNAGSAGGGLSDATSFRWEPHFKENEAPTWYCKAGSPLRIPFLRGVSSGVEVSSTPEAELFILVNWRPLKPAESAEGFQTWSGADRFEKLIPQGPARGSEDSTIQRAAQRLDETRARIKAGISPTVPLESAVFELAVAEARGDQLKIATAGLAYAEAHAAAVQARLDAGKATAAEAAEAATADQEIAAARLRLEHTRTLPGYSEKEVIARSQDEAVRAARARLDEAKKLVAVGAASASDITLAERNLAVAEARGDELKAAEARLAYAEARSEIFRKRLDSGTVTSVEVVEADQELNTARVQLGQVRAKTGAGRDTPPAEGAARP